MTVASPNGRRKKESRTTSQLQLAWCSQDHSSVAQRMIQPGPYSCCKGRNTTRAIFLLQGEWCNQDDIPVARNIMENGAIRSHSCCKDHNANRATFLLQGAWCNQDNIPVARAMQRDPHSRCKEHNANRASLLLQGTGQHSRYTERLRITQRGTELFISNINIISKFYTLQP